MSFRGPGRPNATSGMGVADHSKNTFVELKMKKAHRYVIFKIDEKKKEVVVEKTCGPAESFNDFSAALPDNDCRYAVYDFDFVTSENCQKSKIFFIAWSPDIARVRAKMVYASSKERFRRELDGIHYEIQATDPTEMGLEVFGARAYKTQATDPTKKDLVVIRDRANGSSSISVVGCSSYYEEDEDKDHDDTVTIVYE